MDEPCVCVIDGCGEIVGGASVATDPHALGGSLCACGVKFGRSGFEAVPFAPWLNAGWAAAQVPVIRIETRGIKPFSGASPGKIDRKNARLIAQAMRVGRYRPATSRRDRADRHGCFSRIWRTRRARR